MGYPIIDIKDLQVIFKSDDHSTIAVDQINFSIFKGEVLGVVGESGSGKTVTSLSILKLLPPNSARSSSTGKIFFSKNGDQCIELNQTNEQDIQKIRGKDIAMIFQEPMTSLNPLLTCGKQVTEAILVHNKISYKEALLQTVSLFKKVGLPDPENIIKRFPHQLSGGQKQRVMIAMAMSCKPSLLIADEPTTALDVTVQKNIMKLLKELQKENDMAILYITHDLNLLAEIADRVIVMLKGKIVEQGSIESIFKNPQHSYTKALLACRPKANNKGKRLPVISDFLNEKNEVSTEESVNVYQSEKKSEILLDIKNLVVTFPIKKNLLGTTIKKFTAVDDVTFSIYKSEILGLVGESGCGKTTLGRSMIRLVDPESGSINFNGQNIAELSQNNLKKFRKDIQIIFQDPFGSLNPRMSIGNAIEEPIKVHHRSIVPDERRERVNDLLKKVDLNPAYFSRYPYQFSGGQRQRICIARALALNPGFIICDESVSALDVSVQAQVLNLLTDLKKELNFTCLFISHDLNVVRYISDRIMVMNEGKIVETGSSDQIYFEPKNEYTKQLIKSIPKGFA